MKRRRLIQYAGIGGVGLASGVGGHLLAAAFSSPAAAATSKRLGLQPFNFEVMFVDRRGQEKERYTHQAQYFTTDLGDGVALEMVAIPAGSFRMGSSSTEPNSTSNEYPQHRVSVKSFFMGKHPVTQAQWRAVAQMPKLKRDLSLAPSHFKGDHLPVESVSWLDAVEFCDRLYQHTGLTYRLPSEAEWEYACRAGTTTPFHYGETLTSQLANYGGSFTYAAEAVGHYRQSTTAVGSFAPNPFGLYDMHGNVWEWCADHWHETYQAAVRNGEAWVTGGNSNWRSIRGGAWSDYPAKSRSAYRSGYSADSLNRMIGFRVSCV